VLRGDALLLVDISRSGQTPSKGLRCSGRDGTGCSTGFAMRQLPIVAAPLSRPTLDSPGHCALRVHYQGRGRKARVGGRVALGGGGFQAPGAAEHIHSST